MQKPCLNSYKFLFLFNNFLSVTNLFSFAIKINFSIKINKLIINFFKCYQSTSATYN